MRRYKSDVSKKNQGHPPYSSLEGGRFSLLEEGLREVIEF
jgi:hypothetical protein